MIRRSGKYRFSRRLAHRATGTLLLALPLCGLALSLSPAQAQPTPNKPAPNQLTAPVAVPLSPTQKSEIERVLQVAHNEEVCKYALDLKLDNATIEDVARRIKGSFPNQTIEIRQRDARPLKLSFDLKETTVGTVLQSIAALADCKLWVLPDGLLIAPEDKLISVERGMVEQRQAGEWAQSVQSGGRGWSNQILGKQAFANVIAQEVRASVMKADAEGKIATTFASFSPQGQQAIQQLVTWGTANNPGDSPGLGPLILTPDSPIKVSVADPKRLYLDARSGASEPGTDTIAMNILL